MQTTTQMDPTQATRANEPNGVSSTDTESISYQPRKDQLTTDELYQALSNSRRRQVIRALADGPTDIGALARAIAAVENDVDVDQITGQQRKRVYISLHQVHLSKLDNWGIVEYDDLDQTVAPGPAHQAAVDAMDAVAAADEDPTLRERVVGRIREVVA